MRGGLDESILFIVISSMSGSAAKAFPEKTTPEQKIMQVRSRQRTSPTFFGRACAAGRCGRGRDSVCEACLFMMDVRMLLLIIGFGRKGPALE